MTIINKEMAKLIKVNEEKEQEDGAKEGTAI